MFSFSFSFLSTPSARRATVAVPVRYSSFLNFYPRPPRGGRPNVEPFFPAYILFLSTPSARRATAQNFKLFLGCLDFYPRPPRGGRLKRTTLSSAAGYFYPRPPRGGRHVDPFRRGGCRGISIHALREEGDTRTVIEYSPLFSFLSTPSARRATVSASPSGAAALNFYPRPPRGGRLRCSPARCRRF